MKLRAMITAMILILLSREALAEDLPYSSLMPPGIKSSHENNQAEVLKVFAVDNDGARFRAYLVKWKNSEIIVSDPLGSTYKKEGEMITFLSQRIEMSHVNRNINLLHFIIMDVRTPMKHESNKVLNTVPKKVDKERKRFYALGRVAKESFNKGDYTAAKTYAEELASLAPRYKKDYRINRL